MSLMSLACQLTEILREMEGTQRPRKHTGEAAGASSASRGSTILTQVASLRRSCV